MEGWRKRLWAAIEKDGRSMRAISLAANLGPNYVEQFPEKKRPYADNVLALCKALNVSATYIFTGSPMSRESEEILTLWPRVPERQRGRLLDLLRSFSHSSEAL